MNRLARRLLLALLVLAAAGTVAHIGACGSTTPPPTPVATAPEPPLPPLPRSSLAAVLLHRDELKLSDDQVKAFQDLDEELAEHEKAMTEKPAARSRPDGGVASQPPAGGGSRLHSMSGRGGARHAGGGFHGTQPAPKGTRTPQDRIDDADTRAYLQAEEEILAPEQRDRAREIAEKYREDLYDRRGRMPPPDDE